MDPLMVGFLNGLKKLSTFQMNKKTFAFRDFSSSVKEIIL